MGTVAKKRQALAGGNARPPAAPCTADAMRAFVPPELWPLTNPQTDLPRIARDPDAMALVAEAVRRLPTRHELRLGDARAMGGLKPGSIQLVLTSPPYWTLKEYRPHRGQLGHVTDYPAFLEQLDLVWKQCFDALAPGGRLICVVGDVCLSRRKNGGRHTVVPLHAAIQERCRELGYDNLAPIIWHKIANAAFEADGPGGFLGKPYEPNAVVKNDIEFILMERRPGGYRAPGVATRLLSLLSSEEHRAWFQQIWTGLGGASTRHHPAPYPLELALRLIRMFSFAGDTVLDPFLGTGTTSAAAGLCGRNSIGYEIDEYYLEIAKHRIAREMDSLFGQSEVVIAP